MYNLVYTNSFQVVSSYIYGNHPYICFKDVPYAGHQYKCTCDRPRPLCSQLPNYPRR